MGSTERFIGTSEYSEMGPSSAAGLTGTLAQVQGIPITTIYASI